MANYFLILIAMATKKKSQPENEYSIKELSQLEGFPWKERSIREFIKKGLLKAKFYGYERLTVPESAVKEFLKKYKKTNAGIAKRK
jgi:hypothetical protein